jgi:cation transport ATPase
MTEDQLREIGALNANMGHVLEAIADMKKQLTVVVELVGKHNALADRVSLLESAFREMVNSQKTASRWGQWVPVVAVLTMVVALVAGVIKFAQWLPPVAGH